MRKVLKWLGVALGALVGLVVVGFLVLTLISNRKASVAYAVAPAALTIPATRRASPKASGSSPSAPAPIATGKA
jgi:hypothetical protein